MVDKFHNKVATQQNFGKCETNPFEIHLDDCTSLPLSSVDLEGTVRTNYGNAQLFITQHIAHFIDLSCHSTKPQIVAHFMDLRCYSSIPVMSVAHFIDLNCLHQYPIVSHGMDLRCHSSIHDMSFIL